MPPRRIAILALALSVLSTFSAPVAAQADYRRIYADCSDGIIDGTYTATELEKALQNVDANTGDYSECADAIATARLARSEPRKPILRSNSSQPSTPTDLRSGDPSTPARPTDAVPTKVARSSETDARDADASERAAALTEAVSAADRSANRTASDLRNAAVPLAAQEIGSSRVSLPTPLESLLVACAAAACLAGVATSRRSWPRRRQ